MKTLKTLDVEQGIALPEEKVFVQNRYNPTLDYPVYMIPALMIILIIMICGFLPALNLVSERGGNHRANQCVAGQPPDVHALQADTLLDYRAVGSHARYGYCVGGLWACPGWFHLDHLCGDVAFSASLCLGSVFPLPTVLPPCNRVCM